MYLKTYRKLADIGHREDGFTMVLVMITLLIGSLLVAAALSAASGDTQLIRNDQNQKDAFRAAQAGISDYEFNLGENPNYWTTCPSPTGNVSGNPNATYAITPLTATGQPPVCDPNNPVTSMIEQFPSPAADSFRIRSVGTSNGVQRSIVASFRRKSFLDFLYYTVYETLDPSAYPDPASRAAAAAACGVYYRNNRPTSLFPPAPCVQIFFGPNDSVNGPLHTEDSLAICGNNNSQPVFGRGIQDDIEIVSPPNKAYGNQGVNGCVSNPTWKGNLVTSATSVKPPPSNQQLKQIALPGYQWTGQTHITLGANNMTVTNAGLNAGNPTAMPYPNNGVVFVNTSSCPYDSVGGTSAYVPFNITYTAANGYKYSGAPGCGTLTVDGTTNTSLTLGSDNDIVIDGNITTSGAALVGLIAQNFVRIYHPLAAPTNGGCPVGTKDGAGSLINPTIDAAILSVAASFIVDNYNCGSTATVGTLNITGAIAQIYRGIVGQIGITGYNKNYVYDDRLRTEEPPHFLEPIQAAWHIERETECNTGTAVC